MEYLATIKTSFGDVITQAVFANSFNDAAQIAALLLLAMPDGSVVESVSLVKKDWSPA